MEIATLARAAGRAMIGSTFVALGYDAFRTPGGRVGLAKGTLAAMRTVLPLPEDDEMVVRANAAVQTACGASMALGIAPRLSALAIAGSLVPTTIAGHAFWAIDDPVDSKKQRVQVHKNIALFGALLLIIFGGRRRTRSRTPSRTRT